MSKDLSANLEEATNPEIINNLNELLELNSVQKIETLEDIEKIFSYQKMKENVIQINSEKNTLIIFDTPVFNSCYLIDEFNKFVELLKETNPNSEQEKNNREIEKVLSETDIKYCDSTDVYSELFKAYFGVEKFNIEQPIPLILIISKKHNDINIIEEIFTPLTSGVFYNSLIIANDGN